MLLFFMTLNNSQQKIIEKSQQGRQDRGNYVHIKSRVESGIHSEKYVSEAQTVPAENARTKINQKG